MDKKRHIKIEAEDIITTLKTYENDPFSKEALSLISTAIDTGSDGDVESKCVRAFALGMAFERLGGYE